MIIELFVKDPARVSILNQAVSTLHQINAFGMLMELGANRSIPLPSDRPIENSALRAAWHSGYVEALRDIAHFTERYLENPEIETTRPDFGAADALLREGIIDKQEHEQLRKRTDPFTTDPSAI